MSRSPAACAPPVSHIRRRDGANAVPDARDGPGSAAGAARGDGQVSSSLSSRRAATVTPITAITTKYAT